MAPCTMAGNHLDEVFNDYFAKNAEIPFLGLLVSELHVS